MWSRVALVGIACSSHTLAAEPSEPKLPPTVLGFRSGATRAFVQSSLTVGVPTRGAVGIGYGRPYFASVALDGVGVLTPFYTQAGLTLTGLLSLVQIELGAARVRTFAFGVLPRQRRYDREDLSSRRGHLSYTVLSATLNGTLPLRPFLLLARGQLMATPALGSDVALHEANRFVMRAPLAGFGRYFPLVLLADDASLCAGAVVETLFPGGGAPAIVRVGPSFTADLSAHTDLSLFASVPVTSPDSLGLFYGAGASLALRYRIATGERSADFP